MIRNGEGPLSRALHSGESSHSERMEIRCCDGSAKTILASAAPLRAFDNQIVGAVALIQDLSASEKIEEDLEHAAGLSVKDQGAGIAPEDMPNLFKRFWRGPPPKGSHGGAGLGLAICNEIAAAHGWKLRATNLSPGAHFRLDVLAAAASA